MKANQPSLCTISLSTLSLTVLWCLCWGGPTQGEEKAMIHLSLHSTLVAKTGVKSTGPVCQRTAGSWKTTSRKDLGEWEGRWQMADGVLPHSPAAARSLLYTVSPREPVPSAGHEQVSLRFKNKGYLSWAEKHGSRQRSGKVCIFHWGGIGI